MIQDVSMSISIELRKLMKSTKFGQLLEENGDESDKHIKARDRRY